MRNVPRGGAVWSARMAHNHQVAGSNPAPATKKKVGLYDRLFSWYYKGIIWFCDSTRSVSSRICGERREFWKRLLLPE